MMMNQPTQCDDKNDSLVYPPVLKKLPKYIDRAIIFPIDPFGRKKLGSLPRQQIQKEFTLIHNRFWVISDRVIISPALGAPAVGILMESLIASGIKKILLVGSCGSIREDIPAGTVLIPTEAISACGLTSHYYAEESQFSADPQMVQTLESGLIRAGIQADRAITISTDAPYRETTQFIEKSAKKGAAAIEMECAALFAVACFHRIAAGAVLVTADRVLSDKWERGFGLAKYALKMRRLLNVIWRIEF